jgi:hypothetical protein
MHARKERALQTSQYSPLKTFEVDYRDRTFAIQVFYDPAIQLGNLYVQVLARPGASSTNTQHVTLTHKNIDLGLYFVRPSLVRCMNGTLQVQPKAIGLFPYLRVGTKNTFIVGPNDDRLLERVLEVALAKYNSMPGKSSATRTM